MIGMVLKKDAGFNDSDKNCGPLLCSRDFYLEQCNKHLFEGKRNYEYTEKPKGLILIY